MKTHTQTLPFSHLIIVCKSVKASKEILTIGGDLLIGRRKEPSKVFPLMLVASID